MEITTIGIDLAKDVFELHGADGKARETIEAWRHDYNYLRPHGSLGALTPNEFAMLKGQETPPPQEGEIDVFPIFKSSDKVRNPA